jgi:zinc transport system substrate-binding protein
MFTERRVTHGIRRALLLAALAVMLAPAHAQERETAQLKVAVSILPQAYFVERVGGEFVAVDVLVGPGLSPHTFEPTSKQLTGLSAARVYFSSGIDFETALLPRLRNMFPLLKVVDTRAGVPLRKFSSAESEAEAEHHAHEHAQHADDGPTGRPDPHIWLSPLLAKIQAQTICNTLVELDPTHAPAYRRNLAAFHADLDRVHAQLTEALAPLKGREIFVFHPAFGYFTDAYGLKQLPVEIEGKEPTARQLKDLIERAQAARVKVIFVQPQFAKKSAEALADAIGGVVVPLDDLSRDYLKNLADIAEKIKAGLRSSSEERVAS